MRWLLQNSLRVHSLINEVRLTVKLKTNVRHEPKYKNALAFFHFDENSKTAAQVKLVLWKSSADPDLYERFGNLKEGDAIEVYGRLNVWTYQNKEGVWVTEAQIVPSEFYGA